CTDDEDLPALSGEITCNMGYTCDTVSCCVDVEDLGRTMEVSLSIDHCNRKLTLQLERLSEEISLVDYTWGTLMRHELVGVLRTEIVIYNLAAENSYMVYFNILVCLEANGTCSVNEVILDGRKIIKDICDRSKENEFSLGTWLEEKNSPKYGGYLLEWAEVQLKQDLKIDQFLKTAPCYVYYFYNYNGCENADVKVIPIDHHSSYSCFISENCQSVQCCVNLPTLNTKVTTVFRIIQCRNNLRLEIDNLVHDIKLSEVSYGNLYTFGLLGIVNIKYMIETPSLDTFSLTLNISVCMEPNNDCEFEIEIFKDVVVDQQSCDQAPGFLNPSFSLEDWLVSRNTDLGNITDITANDLMTELGLSDYMGWSNICDVNLMPYNGSVNGWKNECTNITAPFKLNESVVCHITETCDRVTCCAEIPVLKRYIYASVNLRTCDYLLDVDIEENHFEFNLINYEWGKQEKVKIHGVLQLVYAIHHIPSLKLFSMDMKIKACFEGNSSVCLYDYTVMENSQLLYSECDPTVERAPFKDKVVTENIGDTFQYNYSLSSGFDSSKYTVTVDLQVCYLADGFCKTYVLVDYTDFACSSLKRKKRRRRATTEPKVSDFKTGMRSLIKRKASSKEIKEYIDEVKKYENNLVQQNLKGVVLPDTDTKTGSKSAMKALGWNNPATIPLSVDTKASESVTGGDVIQSMLGATFDIPGRTNQAFVVGQGLTNAGVRLLGQKLANMTIGDIENLLDVKNVDPVEVSKLIDELRDLFKALLSEFLTEIVGGDSDFFQSEDLDMMGEIPLPSRSKTVEYGSKMVIASIVTLHFKVGAGIYFGVDLRVGVNIMGMKAIGEITPYTGILVYGEVGIGILIIFANLRLEGYIMELRFPTRGELIFKKFPLDVGIVMDLEMIPIRIKLKVLITLEIIWSITLYKATLWEYSSPSITQNILNNRKDEKDKTSPVITEFIDKPGTERKRSTANCLVRQILDQDYTEPQFEISIHAGDDRSGVRLYLDVGTVPGGRDVLNTRELAGPATILSEVLKASGVPLYFTVTAENDSGQKSKASCDLSTYDITPPGGRFDEDYKTTSNPSVIKASVTVYEDSELVETKVAMGYGKDIWGEQIVPWQDVELDQSNINHITAGNWYM
ncbi:Hypothetical predicted protein, partial [Mytilus galloprovincialis]